jgi:hypothetical protein
MKTLLITALIFLALTNQSGAMPERLPIGQTLIPPDPFKPQAAFPVVSVRSPWPIQFTNLDFESGYGGECLAFLENFVPETKCPQEVNPPADWTVWWYDFDEWHQPEGRLVDRSEDPNRILYGDHSYLWFTFWRNQHVGLWQEQNVQVRGIYKMIVYWHAWYSECSTSPYDGPRWGGDDGCAEIVDWAHLKCRAGITDLNPGPQQIWWGEWEECYSPWCRYESPASLVGGRAGLWFECISDAPLKHQNVYVNQIFIEKGP